METTTPKVSFSFGSAIYAGIVATIIMTVVMALFGVNSITMLGTLLVGKNASYSTIYLAGSLVHFGVGVFYAIVYALLLAPVKSLSNILKAILYSILLTIIAQTTLPHLPQTITHFKQKYFPAATVSSTPPTDDATTPVTTEEVTEESIVTHSVKNKILSKANLKSWLHHLIYALTLVLTYKRKRVD